MGRLEVDTWHWINMVGRTWWGAEPPDSTRPLQHPITWVRFTYEHIRNEIKDLTLALQDCQKYHMKIGRYSDIPYNFLIDNDGTVYEGRGWNFEADRPYCYWGLEGKCLDICYIGDYENEEINPTWEQLQTGMHMIMYGMKEKYISPQYRTIQYRDDVIPSYEA